MRTSLWLAKKYISVLEKAQGSLSFGGMFPYFSRVEESLIETFSLDRPLYKFLCSVLLFNLLYKDFFWASVNIETSISPAMLNFSTKLLNQPEMCLIFFLGL
ncbi:hypothetical protein NGRA_3496 [Nosema granulosis]|uniref:Uncharacterized protein n=1 Tax=Nosema granulosis TaxID=83296 RepID=A0A9P6GXV4_9MICR|nr:hypothetical protein NGRA_3496 [Nosema granulosis]